ncbi:MAG: helix-turn-helix domain-containing protein, partial [Bacteroidota bacterium]
DHTVLPPEIAKEYKAATMTPSSKETRALREMLAELEQQKIREALERCHWNQSEAARELDISERAIRYKMDRLGIIKLDNSYRP